MSETMTCPRRMGELGPWERDEGIDHWRDDDTCSFCGSLKPSKFFELVEQGAVVGPTDKSYKAYVSGPMVHVHGAGKVYFQHFTEGDCQRFVDLYNAHTMHVSGDFYRLPFFVSKG